MLAPVDAKATFEAGGETFTLAMNMRTIALAEREWSEAVTGFLTANTTLTGTSTLLWAFAQPAHPDLTRETALAMVMAHHEPILDALVECFTISTEKAAGADSPKPNPPKKRSRSTR